MLPVSKRVQAGVYALMAISRYRDALVLKPTLGRTLVHQPLVPKEFTASFQVILVPPRAFDDSRLWHVMFTLLWRYFCNSARSIQS